MQDFFFFLVQMQASVAQRNLSPFSTIFLNAFFYEVTNLFFYLDLEQNEFTPTVI